MNKHQMIKIGILVSSSFLAISCSSTLPLPEVRGYKMLTVPSNNYNTGQIVAIWNKPPKEDIIFRPKLSDDVVTSSGGADFAAQIDSATQAEVKARLEQVAEGKLDAGFTKAINFKYTNTRILEAAHLPLIRDINTSLQSVSAIEREYLKDITRPRFFGILPPKVHTDVLTGILIADLEVSIDKTSNYGADVSTTELLDLLGADFRRSGSSSHAVVGKDIVIGYRADPNIMRTIKTKL
jgi:hypothetical protein